MVGRASVGTTLVTWAERAHRWLHETREVHIYFDNTDAGCAFRDVARLRALLEDTAWPTADGSV